MATASAKAIPRIMFVWMVGVASGLRPIACTAPPETMPMPAPAPMAPIMARAAHKSKKGAGTRKKIKKKGRRKKDFFRKTPHQNHGGPRRAARPQNPFFLFRPQMKNTLQGTPAQKEGTQIYPPPSTATMASAK